MQELKQPVQDVFFCNKASTLALWKCKKLIIIARRKYYWCACVFVESKPAYLIIIVIIIVIIIRIIIIRIIIIGIAGFICVVTSKMTAVVVNK